MHEIECWRMRYKALEDKMKENQTGSQKGDKTVI